MVSSSQNFAVDGDIWETLHDNRLQHKHCTDTPTHVTYVECCHLLEILMKSRPINTPLPLIGWVTVTRPITWHTGCGSERVLRQQAFTSPYCEGQGWCNNVRSTAVVRNDRFKANGKCNGSQTVLRQTHRLREELTVYHKLSAVPTNSN